MMSEQGGRVAALFLCRTDIPARVAFPLKISLNSGSDNFRRMPFISYFNY
jgi:hypothetical protein